METNEIIAWLRDQAIRAPTDVLKRGMTRAANRMETMVAALKASGGCGNCKHCHTEWNAEPCDSCRQDPGFPAWEWEGYEPNTARYDAVQI